MKTRVISAATILLLALLPARALAYDEADHFYLSYLAARLAGLDSEDSLAVASAAVAVDQSWGSSPLPEFGRVAASLSPAPLGTNLDHYSNGSYRDPNERDLARLAEFGVALASELKRMRQAQLNLHAFAEHYSVGGDDLSGMSSSYEFPSAVPPSVENGVLSRMNRLYERAVAGNSLDRLGVYLHSVGDYHAHQHGGVHFTAGFGHSICAGHAHSEAAQRLKTKALLEGRVRDYIQLAEKEGHWVDQMANRPMENRRMLRQAYLQIQKFASETGHTLNPPVDREEAMKIINDFTVHQQGSDPQTRLDIERLLESHNVRDVTTGAKIRIPPYGEREGGIVVDQAGNPIRIELTLDQLGSDAVLPVMGGAREQRWADEEFIGVIRSNDTLTGLPLQTEAVAQLKAAETVADEKGVRIAFDRERLRNAVTSSAAVDNVDPMAERILQRFREDSNAWIVDVDEETMAISVAALIGASGKDVGALGWIDRVVGYAVDTKRGDIVLLGKKGPPGQEVLTIDDLVVTLHSVWKQGRTPICSLDPKPGESLDAGFLARVEGVPKRSRFGKVMLDADYDMKRINMGLDSLGIQSMKTVFDHQVVAGTVGGILGTAEVGHLSRYWLTPIQPEEGDIQVSKGGAVVLFRSRVQVQTEVMVMAQEGMIGTNRVNPADEKGVREFTEHFDEIAARRQNFAKLQGLFDLTLMAGLLREHVPECPVLDKLIERPVGQVDVDDEDYTVLYKDFRGRPFMVGGCEVRFPDPVRAAEEFNDPSEMSALLRSMGAPSEVGRARSKRDEYFSEAVEKFWEGRAALEAREPSLAMRAFTRSKSLLGSSIRRDRDFAAAYLLRAFIRLETQTEIDDAMDDCAVAILLRPDLARPYAYRSLGFFYQAMSASTAEESDHVLGSALGSATIAIQKDPGDSLAYLVWANAGIMKILTSEPTLIWDFDIGRVTFRAFSPAERTRLFEIQAGMDTALEIEGDPSLTIDIAAYRGFVSALLGEFDTARSYFASGLGNDSPNTMMYAAMAELLAGNNEEAERHANRCLALVPLAQVYDVRAAVRFNRGEYRAARQDLEASYAVDPSGGSETLGIIESLRELERQ